jgi:type I restriction enzyme R subunit
MVSLVKYALHQESLLSPFSETIEQRYQAWLAQQAALGRTFTAEQNQWLELIRDHIATSLTMEQDEFDLPPFNQRGGLARAHKIFGPTLPKILNELNEVLAA